MVGDHDKNNGCDNNDFLSGLLVPGELRALLQLHVEELGGGICGQPNDEAGPLCLAGANSARMAGRAALLRAEEGPRIQLGAAEETLAELRPRPLVRRGVNLGGCHGLRHDLQQAEPARHGRPDHRDARAVPQERRRQVQGLRLRWTQVSELRHTFAFGRAPDPNSGLNG